MGIAEGTVACACPIDRKLIEGRRCHLVGPSPAYLPVRAGIADGRGIDHQYHLVQYNSTAAIADALQGQSEGDHPVHCAQVNRAGIIDRAEYICCTQYTVASCKTPLNSACIVMIPQAVELILGLVIADKIILACIDGGIRCDGEYP